MSSTLFQRAASFLNRSLPAAAGGQVIYARGENRVAALIASTWGRTGYEADRGGVVTLEHTDRDFLIDPADLVLDGQLATPKLGDRITVVLDGNQDGDIYEVIAPAGNRTHMIDPQGERMRIHARLVVKA